MIRKLVVGNCKVCGQGILEIVKELDTDKLYVRCDECEAEWDNPADALSNKNGNRNRYGNFEKASYEQVQEKEWLSYLA